MRSPTTNGPSPRSKTYATAAALKDVDAIKTSIATVAAPVTYTTFNGVLGGTFDPPRAVTVTTSASGGSYTLTAITFTGTYGGAVVTDTVTLTQTGGGETLYGDQPFDTLTSIAILAMNNTSGAFQFGCGDVYAGSGLYLRAVKAIGADGNIGVQYSGSQTDTLVCIKDSLEPVACKGVLASTTDTGVRIYW